MDVIVTATYVRSRLIFHAHTHKNPESSSHPFICRMCCFCGAFMMRLMVICALLLVRWSRCSLPSLQMWQETWTTRTWFISLLTARRRTRSKLLFFFFHSFVKCNIGPLSPLMTWKWPLCPFMSASLSSVQHSIGGFLSPRNGQLTASTISLLFYFLVFSHVRLLQIKLFFPYHFIHCKPLRSFFFVISTC